jgi:septal ring factor EnvC (AmiA/AmiB activator)
VKEERDIASTVALTNGAENQIRYFLSLSEASPALKQKLREALEKKGTWDGVRRELEQVGRDLQRLNQDQDRIRKNLRETPKDADVYQTYLKKLSDQEKEIDRLTDQQKKLMADEFSARKKYEDYLANISE